MHSLIDFVWSLKCVLFLNIKKCSVVEVFLHHQSLFFQICPGQMLGQHALFLGDNSIHSPSHKNYQTK